MGKNVYIKAEGMTDEEDRIGDVRGWRSGTDVFLSAAEAGDPEQKKRDEEGYSYYPGPYVLSATKMRELLPQAQVVEREVWGEEAPWENERINRLVDLYERLEREGRNPTIWFCV